MNILNNRASIKVNVSWTLLGNSIYSLSRFVILIIIVKLFNPTIVGQFTLALAICSPIFLFCSLKLRSIQSTDANQLYKFSDYSALGIISNVAGFIIIFSYSMMSNYSYEVFGVIVLMGVSKFIEAMSNIIYGLLQQNEAMKEVSQSIIICSILSCVLLTLFLFLTKALIWGIFGIVLSNLLVFILIDIPNCRRYLISPVSIVPSFRKGNLTKLFLLSLPLGIATTLGSFNTNIPRYFIEYNVGLHELGIFSSITYLMIIGGTFINALSQAVTPRLAKYYSNSNYKEFLKLLRNLITTGILLGFLVTLTSIMFGKQILRIIYGEEYAQYSQVLIIITFGAFMLFSSVYLGTAINSMRKFGVQLPIHIASVIVILFGSIFLIDDYGIIGAAWVIFIGQLTSMLGYLIIFSRYYKSNFK